jgi:hypothetical protein
MIFYNPMVGYTTAGKFQARRVTLKTHHCSESKPCRDRAPEGGFLSTFERAIIANNSIALGIARHPFSMHQQGQCLMVQVNIKSSPRYTRQQVHAYHFVSLAANHCRIIVHDVRNALWFVNCQQFYSG